MKIDEKFNPCKMSDETDDIFVKCYKALVENEEYDLTSDAIILYGYLREQVKMSIQNRWCDKDGNVYIIFTREKAQKLLGIKHRGTIHKRFQELVDHNLIKETWKKNSKTGSYNPKCIYVGKPAAWDRPKPKKTREKVPSLDSITANSTPKSPCSNFENPCSSFENPCPKSEHNKERVYKESCSISSKKSRRIKGELFALIKEEKAVDSFISYIIKNHPKALKTKYYRGTIFPNPERFITFKRNLRQLFSADYFWREVTPLLETWDNNPTSLETIFHIVSECLPLPLKEEGTLIGYIRTSLQNYNRSSSSDPNTID